MRKTPNEVIIEIFKDLLQSADKKQQRHIDDLMSNIFAMAKANNANVGWKHDADARTFSIGVGHDANDMEIVAEVRFTDKSLELVTLKDFTKPMPRGRKAKFFDTTKLPDLSANTINDSGVSADVVKARLADGITIKYGDITMMVERRALEDAKKTVAEISPVERQRVMRSVDTALRKTMKTIETGGPSTKEENDNFFHDLVLWTALQEYATA